MTLKFKGNDHGTGEKVASKASNKKYNDAKLVTPSSNPPMTSRCLGQAMTQSNLVRKPNHASQRERHGGKGHLHALGHPGLGLWNTSQTPGQCIRCRRTSPRASTTSPEEPSE